jgi:hypothetical protein
MRLDHTASRIVNANHSIMRAAVKLRITLLCFLACHSREKKNRLSANE